MLTLLLALFLGADIDGVPKAVPYRIFEYTAKGGDRSSFDWQVTPLSPGQVFDIRVPDKFGQTLLFTGSPGRYRISLTEIGPSGNDDRPFFILRAFLDVEVGSPTPSPTPTPTPTPGPTPGPTPVSPIAKDGVCVLMVYESGEGLSSGQVSAMNGAKVTEFLNRVCVRGSDGRPCWRIYDKDSLAANDDPIWSAALKRQRSAIPWLIISNGSRSYEGPLPKSEAEMLSLLERHVGK